MSPHVSLNEVEAEMRKAARGAGLPWGLAEEAGKAARRMAAAGHDALADFADLLDAHKAGRVAPHVKGDGVRWEGTGAPLSPLTLGPAVADNAFRLRDGEMLAFGPIACPVCLLPFLAAAAEDAGVAVEFAWDGGACTIGADGTCDEALEPLRRIRLLADARCRATERAPCTPLSEQWMRGIDVDAETWSRIGRLAALTYVPASDLSRNRGAGAGAGRLDND